LSRWSRGRFDVCTGDPGSCHQPAVNTCGAPSRTVYHSTAASLIRPPQGDWGTGPPIIETLARTLSLSTNLSLVRAHHVIHLRYSISRKRSNLSRSLVSPYYHPYFGPKVPEPAVAGGIPLRPHTSDEPLRPPPQTTLHPSHLNTILTLTLHRHGFFHPHCRHPNLSHLPLHFVRTANHTVLDCVATKAEARIRHGHPTLCAAVAMEEAWRGHRLDGWG